MYELNKFIICIDGRCGVGKSTIAKYIAKKMQAQIIGGAEFLSDLNPMRETIKKSVNDFEEKAKVWLVQVYKDIEKKILNMKGIIIIEMVGISGSKIWQNANIKIFIDSCDDKRISAMTKTKIKPHIITKEEAINLGKVFPDMMQSAKQSADIVFHNNYDNTVFNDVDSFLSGNECNPICMPY